MDIIPEEVMDDLYIRFQHDLDDFCNIFSNIEMMYWFYLDQFSITRNLPKVDLIDFATQFFFQYKLIIPKGFIWEEEFDKWKAQKSKTPTASAIIMDETLEMMIMVKGFGSKRWTFPGGKKEAESFKDCAIREVDEEIGYDISKKIDDDLCIAIERDGVKRYHYIIIGVSLDTKFKPKTNFEIEKITWFPLIHLPESKLDDCLNTIDAHAKDFLASMHIIKIIKKWVGLLKTYNKKEALKIAIQDIHNEELKASKPRSKSFSDSKTVAKTNQKILVDKIVSHNMVTIKNKMISIPKKNQHQPLLDSLWTGIHFNKDEFINDFLRQIQIIQ